MPIIYKSGNIVDDSADILVCTVNTVGVMGKGVAKSFKDAFPDIEHEYLKHCRSDLFHAGDCCIFPLPRTPGSGLFSVGRYWAAMATKKHWRNPSEYPWVYAGLLNLRLAAKSLRNVRSIAIPPPGCGNGGLDWIQVHPMVIDILSEFDLRIYADPP